MLTILSKFRKYKYHISRLKQSEFLKKKKKNLNFQKKKSEFLEKRKSEFLGKKKSESLDMESKVSRMRN